MIDAERNRLHWPDTTQGSPMKSNPPLLAAALLGSLVIASPVLANEPPPTAPSDTATAADVPAADAGVVAAVAELPAWKAGCR